MCYTTSDMRWLIGTLLAGLILGALGRLVLPGRQSIGIWMTILLGVVGSFVGLLIAAVVPFFDHRELSGLIFNVTGAALAIAAYERLAAPRR